MIGLEPILDPAVDDEWVGIEHELLGLDLEFEFDGLEQLEFEQTMLVPPLGVGICGTTLAPRYPVGFGADTAEPAGRINTWAPGNVVPTQRAPPRCTAAVRPRRRRTTIERAK